MNAISWILLFLPIGVLAYVIAFRMSARTEKHKRMNRRGAASHSEMRKHPLRIYKYRAVELQICDEPCESALAIAGKRLLKSDAPALPLAGCPHKKCMCAYTQYDDRRLMQRRSDSYPYGMPMGGSGRTREERRKAMRDRRGHSLG